MDISKFIVRIFYVLVLSIAFSFLLYISVPPPYSHLLAATIVKHELLKSINEPKIVVVGGSNVYFGVSAQNMQADLGVPVVNDGLFAGLAFYPIYEIKDHIHAGDVIIIAYEYQAYTQSNFISGDAPSVALWVEFAPVRVKYYPNIIKQAPMGYAITLQNKVHILLNGYLYQSSGNPDDMGDYRTVSNSNGDFDAYVEGKTFKINNGAYPVSNFQPRAMAILKDFNKYAAEIGAEIYLAAPASREANCKKTSVPKIMKLLNRVSRETDIPLLTLPDQICLPDKYFYDTEYHLTAEGRAIRTQYLIDALKPLIAK